MTSDNKNGWNEWSNKVLGDLEELKQLYKEITNDITELKIQLAIIKTKAALYGAISGTVVGVVLTALIRFIVKSTLGEG